MNDNDIIAKELLPIKGWFGSLSCPSVDDAHQWVLGLDQQNELHLLENAKARNNACEQKMRLWSISKQVMSFSTLIPKVGHDDNGNWDYLWVGTLSIIDPIAFWSQWQQLIPNVGTDGLKAGYITQQLFNRLSIYIKDELTNEINNHKWTIKEIDEKDVIPNNYWNKCFFVEKCDEPLLKGLKINLSEKSLLNNKTQNIKELKDLYEAQKKIQEELNNQAFKSQEMIEKLEAANKEANKKIQELSEQLEEKNKMSAEDIQKEMNNQSTNYNKKPSYTGMSDKFKELIDNLNAHSKDAITMSIKVLNQRGTVNRDIFATQWQGGEEESRPKNVLHPGENIILSLSSARSGYLTLINLGLSGNVATIFPAKEFGNCQTKIEAYKEYKLPGELANTPNGCWFVGKQLSESTGLPDRILAIVSDEPHTFNANDLGIMKQTITRSLSQPRGGFASVEEEITKLFELKPGSWCFGLLETWVE